MGTLPGGATLPLLFFSSIQMGVDSLRKEFAPVEQILSFQNRLHFLKVLLCRKATRKSQKLFLFVKKSGENMDVCLHTLKMNLLLRDKCSNIG